MATTKKEQEVNIETQEVVSDGMLEDETLTQKMMAAERRGRMVATQSVADNFLNSITRAAADPNVDMIKMNGLYEMAKEERGEQARIIYNRDMAICQGEMTVIEKKHKNKQTNSFYAKMEDMIASVKPVLTKHGFSLSFSEVPSPIVGEVTVRLVISHDAGQDREFLASRPIVTKGLRGNEMMTETHARQSAVTYAEKAALASALSLEIAFAGDDDGNGGDKKEATMVTDAQLTILKKKVADAKVDESRLKAWMEKSLKVSEYKDLNDMGYKVVMEMVDTQSKVKK